MPLLLPRDIVELRLLSLIESDGSIMFEEILSEWDGQRNALTDAVIRRMVSAGQLTDEVLEAWEDSYVDFVVNRMSERWSSCARFAGAMLDAPLEALGTRVPFDAFRRNVAKWIDKHGASTVVNLSDLQRRALRRTLLHYIAEDPRSPADLARIIRPMVGLTPRQADAILRQRTQDEADGLAAGLVEQRAMRRAEQMARVRATRIARTEMATAYNQGHKRKMEEAIAEGLPGKVSKEWSTAEDERVCKLCGPLDGKTVGFNDAFVGSFTEPPRHPGCRCTVLYDVALPTP